MAKWLGKKITYAWLEQEVEKRTREKQNSLRRYSEDTVQALEWEQNDLLQRIDDLENEKAKVSARLTTEKQKVDSFSIDTSLIQKVAL